MKKLFLFLFSVLPALLYAERISIDEARQTAETFMQSKSLNRSTALRQAQVARWKIGSNKQVSQQPKAYYIFRSDNGSAPTSGQDNFAVTVIAAADDRLPAILGYSVENQPSMHGDDGSLPPALEAWLDDFDNLVEQYDNKNKCNIGHTSNYLEVKIPDEMNKSGQIIKTIFKK